MSAFNIGRYKQIDGIWLLEEAFAITALSSFSEEEYILGLQEARSGARSRGGPAVSPSGVPMGTRNFRRKTSIQPRAGMAPPVAFWDDEDDWEEEDGKATDKPYTIEDGIALLAVDGPITKKPSSASWYYGGTSGVLFRRAIRTAYNDPDVRGAMIDFDTPGGQSAGMWDMWNDIFSFSQIKPVYGYAADLCASAGYWAAAGCNRFSVGEAAEVPCIGTYMMLYDSSKYYKDRGIVPMIFKAGEFKGIGEDGLELTGEQKAYLQDLVSGTNEHFLNCVSIGLGMPMETLRPLANGKLYQGAEAVKLGFADAVETYDEAFTALSSYAPPLKRIYAAGVGNGPESRAEGNIIMRLPTFGRSASGAGTDNPGTAPAAVPGAEPVSVVSALQEAGATKEAGLLLSLESNGIKSESDLSRLVKEAAEGRGARSRALEALSVQVTRFNTANGIKSEAEDGSYDVAAMYGAYSVANLEALTATFKRQADAIVTHPGGHTAPGSQATETDTTVEQINQNAAANEAEPAFDVNKVSESLNARRGARMGNGTGVK